MSLCSFGGRYWLIKKSLEPTSKNRCVRKGVALSYQRKGQVIKASPDLMLAFASLHLTFKKHARIPSFFL